MNPRTSPGELQRLLDGLAELGARLAAGAPVGAPEGALAGVPTASDAA